MGRGRWRGQRAQSLGCREHRKVGGGARAAGLAGQGPCGRPRRGLHRRRDPQVWGSRGQLDAETKMGPAADGTQSPETSKAREGTPARWGAREEASAPTAKADIPGRREQVAA